MTEATDSDLLKCAETEVPVVVCTRSNKYFGRTPPLKRMLDCGVDIAVGTDNAMLCDPDMRSEISALAEVLHSQSGSAEDILRSILPNGRKLLYPNNKIHVSVGMTAGLTVLPYIGGPDTKGILMSRDLVFRYEPKGEIK
jgi:cytosine/adenosine deaminase-related metal-dependent hydrolase